MWRRPTSLFRYDRVGAPQRRFRQLTLDENYFWVREGTGTQMFDDSSSQSLQNLKALLDRTEQLALATQAIIKKKRKDGIEHISDEEISKRKREQRLKSLISRADSVIAQHK